MHQKYDKRPIIPVSAATWAMRSWRRISHHLGMAVQAKGSGITLTIDCYPGVDQLQIASAMNAEMPHLKILSSGCATKCQSDLDALLAPFLTDDRVFGCMSPLRMEELLDPGRVQCMRRKIEAERQKGPVAVVGIGAAEIWPGDILVVADMPRWEIQKRLRAGARNWTADNPDEDMLRKFKRGYFVEWRVADRHKLPLLKRADYFLDTTVDRDPKLVDGDSMRLALAETTTRPFRVVPFFDPGIWGGQWMREKFSLPADKPNYAWGFDCVPEENSLVFSFGGVELEVPALNLVLMHPVELLGPDVHSRFGAEFPIRFDFLDTFDGGNLSLQVHPTKEFIRECFGVPYTQDESYYIMAAGPGAAVYLGMKDGADTESFFHALEAAQDGGAHPDIERFVNRWPARQHDHFSIPAGTVHCCASNCVVLEISATPYIFTFKLWDWGRTGMDGLPRPVHLDYGRTVLCEDRNTSWVKNSVLALTEPVAQGDRWREERTGLHELEFIETRRHWFDGPVSHKTKGSVHVLNVVDGDRAVIESPDGSFAPYFINYAETVIIPELVGSYTVRPLKDGQCHATIRASVRI